MGNWENNIRKVVPYTPGEQPDAENMIKLNTNENPYPPSPKVAKLLKSFNSDELRLYPDPKAQVLVDALADRYAVKPSQVFVGVGSDDVLAMCYMTFFNSGKPILFPDITYSFYDVWANLYNIPFKDLPLDENLCIVKEDYYQDNGGVIFPNPNAPTGVDMRLTDIEDIIAHNRDVICIVDEAYIDFGGESAIPLVEKYDNLIVVQTFSKSRSMAGTRIGYAIGNERLIKYLNDVKYSFNSYTIDRVSMRLGAAAVEDEAYFKETVRKIIATRERTKEELQALGFEMPESKSNFLFISHPKLQAKKLLLALREQNIYVRYFDKPRIDNMLRVTIGTDEQMDCFLAFIKEYLKKENIC